MSNDSHIWLRNGAEDRKEQEIRRSIISLTLSSLLLFSAFIYPVVRSWLSDPVSEEQLTVEVKKVINYAQLSAPPPIDLDRPEPEQFKVAPKVKQIKFLQPVPKKDEEVEEDEYMPTMDELSEAQIGTTNIDGVDSIVVETSTSIEAPVVDAPILSFVEIMPNFKGGDHALMAYLGENLSYPGMAKDLNIEGVVFVRFVVEADGSIGEVTTVRGVFNELDREAERVIKQMPAWNPGQQNGRNVRVYYTIPIRFDLR
jgi:protein TonB